MGDPLARECIMIRVGTAGWSIPSELKEEFPEGDSHLERYGRVFTACEINRTFKKMPRDSTFERWAETVPEDFRFSVKVSREITHDHRLEEVAEPVEAFLDGIHHLGDRLGPLLIQLPPSLEIDFEVARDFLSVLRERHDGGVALEARHESWFGEEAEDLLTEHGVARVAADPPRAEEDGDPGGTDELAYFRLHGQPEIYRSPYRDDGLEGWLERVREAADSPEDEEREVWLVFDNTAEGEGTADALRARDELEGSSG